MTVPAPIPRVGFVRIEAKLSIQQKESHYSHTSGHCSSRTMRCYYKRWRTLQTQYRADWVGSGSRTPFFWTEHNERRRWWGKERV